jgi:hypothetical protein
LLEDLRSGVVAFQMLAVTAVANAFAQNPQLAAAVSSDIQRLFFSSWGDQVPPPAPVQLARSKRPVFHLGKRTALALSAICRTIGKQVGRDVLALYVVFGKGVASAQHHRRHARGLLGVDAIVLNGIVRFLHGSAGGFQHVGSAPTWKGTAPNFATFVAVLFAEEMQREEVDSVLFSLMPLLTEILVQTPGILDAHTAGGVAKTIRAVAFNDSNGTPGYQYYLQKAPFLKIRLLKLLQLILSTSARPRLGTGTGEDARLSTDSFLPSVHFLPHSHFRWADAGSRILSASAEDFQACLSATKQLYHSNHRGCRGATNSSLPSGDSGNLGNVNACHATWMVQVQAARLILSHPCYATLQAEVVRDLFLCLGMQIEGKHKGGSNLLIIAMGMLCDGLGYTEINAPSKVMIADEFRQRYPVAEVVLNVMNGSDIAVNSSALDTVVSNILRLLTLAEGALRNSKTRRLHSKVLRLVFALCEADEKIRGSCRVCPFSLAVGPGVLAWADRNPDLIVSWDPIPKNMDPWMLESVQDSSVVQHLRAEAQQISPTTADPFGKGGSSSTSEAGIGPTMADPFGKEALRSTSEAGIGPTMADPFGKAGTRPTILPRKYLPNTQVVERLGKLRTQAGNELCFFCRGNDPCWASTEYGIFICMPCSDTHRSVGHSGVRSLRLDRWTHLEVKRMELGGNRNAHAFFKNHGVASVQFTPRLLHAMLYAEQLNKLCEHDSTHHSITAPPSWETCQEQRWLMLVEDMELWLTTHEVDFPNDGMAETCREQLERGKAHASAREKCSRHLQIEITDFMDRHMLADEPKRSAFKNSLPPAFVASWK